MIYVKLPPSNDIVIADDNKVKDDLVSRIWDSSVGKFSEFDNFNEFNFKSAINQDYGSLITAASLTNCFQLGSDWVTLMLMNSIPIESYAISKQEIIFIKNKLQGESELWLKEATDSVKSMVDYMKSLAV